MTAHGPRWTGEVRLAPDKLDDVLSWRTFQRVFVSSMSDLFHEKVPDAWIDEAFARMAVAKHQYLALTKRADRQRAYLSDPKTPDRIEAIIARLASEHGWTCIGYLDEWPLSNYWAGVSVEDRASALKRVPDLRETPAAIRWVSAEPLLEDPELDLTGIDWVVVGGESGPGSRPFDVQWARKIVRQCARAGVACFVKQMGAHYVDAENGIGGVQARPDPTIVPSIRRLTSRKGCDVDEWPGDLRVRDFPRALNSIE